jgi:predicted enzyme related to lactoylglutathione lyase
MKIDPKPTPASLAAADKNPTISRRLMITGAAAIVAGSAGAPTGAQAAAADPDVGTVWWSELLTRDPARARAFYSRVVGWTPKVVALDDPTRPAKRGEKEYTMFSAGDKEAAGAMKIDEDTEFPGIAVSWLTYVQVVDVDAAARRAVEAGGKLLHEPADVPNVGRVAIIEDPEGARIGLVSPA